MTALADDSQRAPRSRSQELQEEVARSLERELQLLAEDRHERARKLGLDIGTATPRVSD